MGPNSYYHGYWQQWRILLSKIRQRQELHSWPPATQAIHFSASSTIHWITAFSSTASSLIASKEVGINVACIHSLVTVRNQSSRWVYILIYFIYWPHYAWLQCHFPGFLLRDNIYLYLPLAISVCYWFSCCHPLPCFSTTDHLHFASTNRSWELTISWDRLLWPSSHQVLHHLASKFSSTWNKSSDFSCQDFSTVNGLKSMLHKWIMHELFFIYSFYWFTHVLIFIFKNNGHKVLDVQLFFTKFPEIMDHPWPNIWTSDSHKILNGCPLLLHLSRPTQWYI